MAMGVQPRPVCARGPVESGGHAVSRIRGGRRNGCVRVKATAAAGARNRSAKDRLLRALEGTQRGAETTAMDRAEIAEILTELEANTPVPRPTEELNQLAGTWRLLYTSNSELTVLLKAGTLPFIEIGDIIQEIDISGSVENRVELGSPLVTSSVSATASLEARSPKRVAVEFDGGKIATPSLKDDIMATLPDAVDVLGREIPIGQLRDAVAPQIQTAIRSVQGLLDGQSDLSFPIPSTLRSQLGEAAKAWLVTTYLDDTLRVARGEAGSVFVLWRESSPPPVEPSFSVDTTADGEARGAGGELSGAFE